MICLEESDSDFNVSLVNGMQRKELIGNDISQLTIYNMLHNVMFMRIAHISRVSCQKGPICHE